MASDVFRITSHCLCGHALNAVGDPADRTHRPPRRGDLTVCIYCARVLECDGTAFRPISRQAARRLTKRQIAEIAELRERVNRLPPPPETIQ